MTQLRAYPRIVLFDKSKSSILRIFIDILVDIHPKTVSTALITITSIGNFSGRLLAGILSDHFVHCVPRVFWTQLSSVLMAITYGVLYCVGDRVEVFYPGAFMVGLSFGIMFTTVISSVADLFGTKYLSGNYCFLDSSPMSGSLIFSVLIFGRLYDAKGKEQGNGTHCDGKECYATSFLICSGAAVCAFWLSFYLWRLVQWKQRQQRFMSREESLLIK